MRNLVLGPILFASALGAAAACSDATGAASTEDVDGGAMSDDASTVEASANADAASCIANQYRSGAECKPCSGACGAGSYESSACSPTADRACSPCAAIAACASVTCTSATNQQCAACAASFYLSGGACVACSGACPAGEAETAACSATADRVCTSCTPIPSCTDISCTNGSDQVCSACVADQRVSNNACVACSAACAAGTYESVACAGATDRECTGCTAVEHCSSAITCTAANDSQCTGCAAGHYLVDGEADSCAACSAVEHCSSAITCTAANDSQCTGCAAGHYLVDDEADSCAACTAVPNCAVALTCTTSTNQNCASCSDGYVRDDAGRSCRLPKTCAELRLSWPATPDGVYSIDPDGADALTPFDVYCDMTTDGGGWTLIGKVGQGKWPELTDRQFIDLYANPIADVGSALLMTGDLPNAKEIAWFRRDRTNAMYRATPYAGQSAVRVIFDSDYEDDSDGHYFQQRKTGWASTWDFWVAIRDARVWSSLHTFTPPWVRNFGTHFALTGTLSSWDPATNTVTHDTGGDLEFGWWESRSITLADNSSLEVSRHGGLLCDGVGGRSLVWLLTMNSSDSRYKNEQYESKSTIWLR